MSIGFKTHQHLFCGRRIEKLIIDCHLDFIPCTIQRQDLFLNAYVSFIDGNQMVAFNVKHAVIG